jgi:tRNA-dihydrouridine synthase
VDLYFTPFLSPNANLAFSPKEWREIDPRANEHIPTVPQLLTNNADHFLWASGKLRELGYARVDFNLGCPSGTVTAKRKGAGFLIDLPALECFLGKVYANADNAVSIKTRLGKTELATWEPLLAMYGRFPVAELTVHPRLASDGYKGEPRLEAMGDVWARCPFPVCYNGNIYTVEDAARLQQRFSQMTTVMLGRGLMANPALARELRGGAPLTAAELRDYTEELYAAYRRYYEKGEPAVGRMKEQWFYISRHFADAARPLRRIQKADTPPEYEGAVAAFWRDCTFVAAENGFGEGHL